MNSKDAEATLSGLLGEVQGHNTGQSWSVAECGHSFTAPASRDPNSWEETITEFIEKEAGTEHPELNDVFQATSTGRIQKRQ